MSKEAQTYDNHSRYHPIHHFFVGPLGLIVIVTSLIYCIIMLIKGTVTTPIILLFILSITSFLTGVIARINALSVQDRLIQSEEQFRHYLLTGELLNPGLTREQIIALRFASDKEFPELCKKAVKSKMKPDDIKKSIQEWRPDDYRV